MPYSATLPSGSGQAALVESTQADGKTFQQLRQECLQKGKLFEDPDFPAVDDSLFYSQKVPINFEWKRPGEICKDPKFITGGATRTDICQGQLGDCWLLAAIASLTLHDESLKRVVPHDQSFDRGYAGIFHFQFWQHNKWLDVVVDDRLPCVRNNLVFVHSADNTEFWSALLEKAYAKLNGSYESLKGGSTMEAMEDFTGGVGEMYETKNGPSNLFVILKKAVERGSMLGCSIDITSSAESEAQTTTGLVKGHAYSITGVEEVNYRGSKVQLIRVRNPWGQVEWNGPWSDNSREWNTIDSSEKKRLLHNSLDDGEFWMEFGDFKANYNKVEICNLTADSLSDDVRKKWEVNLFEGNWIRGSTAGGCRNFIDDGDKLCSVIVALMQKNRRRLRKEGLDLETIGFAIYEAPNDQDHQAKDFFRYNPSKARSRTYINMREVSERFRLPPGNYLLDKAISARELQHVLNNVLSRRKEVKFDGLSLNTCHSIINLMDVDSTGLMEFEEFKVFWDKLKKWIMLFLSHDTDRSGRMSSYELRSALNAAGIQLNNKILQLLGLRFADENYDIDFDDYLTCIVRLENMFRIFQALDQQKKGKISLNIMQVICFI
ncbi:Calpain-1 catalytic subunit [Labeo rohita]|uniref:Calpain-1 catalytic subunit n=1 Tax=Labeo rohita TaxID=84645 RepID=A0ABQ8MZ52_LABRO|nr:Calpain-1 catalytic subunit [Labeo rohita]